jgi:DNA-binding CsgD family transcriptional regulator
MKNALFTIRAGWAQLANKTLIRRLQITELEQQSMKTIISDSEKYRRKLVKENAGRRNADGLTAREQAKQERINEVMKLKGLKLNQSEIARKLSISRQAVSKIIKNLKYVN